MYVMAFPTISEVPHPTNYVVRTDDSCSVATIRKTGLKQSYLGLKVSNSI